jgi:hypothetical protein
MLLRAFTPYHEQPRHLAADSEVFPYLFNNTLFTAVLREKGVVLPILNRLGCTPHFADWVWHCEQLGDWQ